MNWKRISLYPNYEVSNTGKIRNTETGKELEGFRKHGDRTVKFPSGREYAIKYIVWTHFVGVKPKKHVLETIDPGKPDSVDNIRLIKKTSIRVSPPGRKDKTSVLEGTSKLIKHLYEVDRMSTSDIARTLGITTPTIYKHLKKHEVKLRGSRSKGRSYV